MGKMKGYDSANPATGYSDKSDGDDFDPTIVTVSGLLTELASAMYGRGYRMQASATGVFAGYDVYVQTCPDLPGVKVPRGFTYLAPLKPGDFRAATFRAVLKEVCEGYRADAFDRGDKSTAGRWKDICLAFIDNPSDPRSTVARASMGLRESCDRITTVSGLSGAHKFIPCLEWFTPELQAYNPEDLLTLFPEAERKQLMVILGRLMVGAKDTQLMEGYLNHTARSYAIVVGTDPGMGKSTLLNYLVSSIGNLGYTSFTINPVLDKFSWAQVATSDLAYIDDLTGEVQRKLIGSNDLKSVVSNGTMFVQEKGVQGVQVRATAAVLALTNSYSYSDYIGIDSGSLDRLNLLDTYRRYEMAEAHPDKDDALIKPYWEAQATKYGCTVETLMYRLLRHCTDLFLDLIGWGGGEDTLESVVKDNRTRFRIDVSLKHSEELAIVLARMTALAIHDPRNSKSEYGLDYLDFGLDLVLPLMAMWVDTPVLPAGWEMFQLKHLSLDCLPFIRAKMAELGAMHRNKSADGAFGMLMGELKSTKAFGYPKSAAHYQHQWVAERRAMKQYLAETADKQTDMPDALYNAVNRINAILISYGTQHINANKHLKLG